VRTHPEHIAASLAALLEVVHRRDRA
jgi:hypothetical protein